MTSKRREVVIVDDDESTLDLIEGAFEVGGIEFEFNVQKLKTIPEYHDVVHSGPIHVLCIDINLNDPKGDGIDGIAAFHKFVSPSTVILVYSAFSDADKVTQTVRAMKAGAAAVIDKNMAEFDRRLVDAAVMELRERTTLGGIDLNDWLTNELPKLSESYGGQAVALKGSDVIANAATVSELRKKLANQPVNDVIIFLVPELEPVH